MTYTYSCLIVWYTHYLHDMTVVQSIIVWNYWSTESVSSNVYYRAVAPGLKPMRPEAVVNSCAGGPGAL